MHVQMSETHFRIEQDLIGEHPVPADALYGIHSLRAVTNFPDQTLFKKDWYCALGVVKEACYLTYKKFSQEISLHSDPQILSFKLMSETVVDALIDSSRKVGNGECFEHFIVPAIQGGAGTSINMNVNEIIANLALVRLGFCKGEYYVIDPIEQANVFQSTNDVVPTALKVAALRLLGKLDEEINQLRSGMERLENQYQNSLRVAYTQMQEAVPSTYGKLLSGYNNALSRDWWRVSKCMERMKEVNLGGGAVGTGLSIPRYFIFNVVSELQRLTGLPISRADNLSDNTANLDSFVEVHAVLKAHAVNLEKMVNDVRLMASDLFKNRQVVIPQKQAGSSIMPGKVNPVIPEFVICCVHKVYSNDLLISNLCGQGCLDLNAYLPSIGHALIDSIETLIHANQSATHHLFSDFTIQLDEGIVSQVFDSPSITTALIPFIGYHKAGVLAKEMKAQGVNVFKANEQLRIMSDTNLNAALSVENLIKLGYVMDDLSRS